MTAVIYTPVLQYNKQLNADLIYNLIQGCPVCWVYGGGMVVITDIAVKIE